MADPPAARDASPSLPSYDDSEWPIFQVKMPPVALSPADFEAHLNSCSERYRRGQPFCMLIDMGDHPPLGAARRKAVADRMIEDGQRYPGVMLRCALVVRSAPARGAVTAINWVAQPAYPFTAFGDAREAKAWLVERLAAEKRERGPPRRQDAK
jgi:hypothetical protein